MKLTAPVGSGLAPGDMVAGRFKIRRFLGKGRFAEVFEADDTQYNRYVALKMPFEGVGPGAELWRLVNEVKAAQCVAHPNIVRAWELGAFEGPSGDQRHYIASQLIEGGTLRTVLELRLGGLTESEKLGIAHDLCAGLEAIHKERILHRDLKPENVMLTLDGRALIADFGLATLAGGAVNPRAGTAGYRALELRKGEQPTVQSDLYALGVVLYELFTGREPFPEGAASEASDDGREELPVWPAAGGDERVKEAVQRCLYSDPVQRPRSAHELSEKLPPRPLSGDDQSWTVPVETLLIDPVPTFSPTTPWRLLMACLLGLALVVALGSRVQLLGAATAGDPPLVLEYKARDLARELGFDHEPRDRLQGYMPQDKSGSSAVPAMPPLAFWYRQSPAPLVAGRSGTAFLGYADPPFAVPGEVGVQLDTQGRLLRLDAVPRADPRTARPGSDPDWVPLLHAAGLDPDRLRAVAPSATLLRFADQRSAWEGEDPDRPGRSVRVEAAALGSTPVFFRRVIGWEGSPTEVALGVGGDAEGERTSAAFVVVWISTGMILAIGLYLSRRSLRRRTADLKGATRLAAFVLGARVLVWLLGGHHLSSSGQIEVLEAQLERGLHDAVRVWILYVALEPIARRRWARQVASWVRLLRGRWHDPLLGRDLLVGSVFGLGLSLCGQLYAAVPGMVGLSAPSPERVGSMAGLLDDGALARQCQAILGLRESLAVSLYAMLHALVLAFFATVGVVFLRWLLRRAVWSRPTAVFLMSIILYPSAGHPLADALVAVVISALWVTVLVRFGFLAAVTATVVAWWVNSHPLTLDLDAWYASGAMVPVVLVAAVISWGFWAALGTQSAMPSWMKRILESELDNESQPAAE